MPVKNKPIKKKKQNPAESKEKKDTRTKIELGGSVSFEEPVNNLEPGPDEIALTPEEELFVTHLFRENMNRTRAYMHVYPNAARDSARSSASRMLARDNVKAEVERRLNEEAMTVEEGIAKVSRIARGTILPFVKRGPDGFVYFDLSHPDAQDHMYLIKRMETKRERRIVGSGDLAEEWEGEWVKVELYDSYTATIDMLKIHGKFTKKIDLTSDGKPLPAVDHEGFDRSINALADALLAVIQNETKDDNVKP